MNQYEKDAKTMKDFIESDEGKAYIKKSSAELAERMRITKERMREIFSNFDYVNWLERFILEHEKFMDDSWVYFSERISEEDNKLLKDLWLFFEGIGKYADKMNIECIYTDWGIAYKVRWNDVGFIIEELHAQGIHIACKRIPVEQENKLIDIADVINFINVDSKLQDLYLMIKKVYNDGCTKEEIIDMVNNTIEKLTKSEINKELNMKKLGR